MKDLIKKILREEFDKYMYMEKSKDFFNMLNKITKWWVYENGNKKIFALLAGDVAVIHFEQTEFESFISYEYLEMYDDYVGLPETGVETYIFALSEFAEYIKDSLGFGFFDSKNTSSDSSNGYYIGKEVKQNGRPLSDKEIEEMKNKYNERKKYFNY